MVQRKEPNKLCIQTDLHLKSEKGLENLSPSSPRRQESKNKGTNLKKKMKKSRSIKRTNFEKLKSHTYIREVAQPGKPPPLCVSTPQKQSPNKGSDASPNYMKSTSSFDARKERSQVNSKSSQPAIENKGPKKLSKTGTMTSSLKLVRTLTKSPTFKPARVTAKKCSQVVLCENLEVQRATCSSTLKDSRFPTYLALSPGATESEGTSAMKVCPYTYCSLNGHRHAPLPPLKCFLTARRRMLKAQKSMKLGCLSTSRVKPSSDEMKEIVTEKITLDDKQADQEMDLHEDHADFFIEIYVGNVENGEEKEEIDFDVDEEGDEKVVERCSNEAPWSEIHYGQNIHNRCEVSLKEKETVEEVYSALPTQAEETPESLSYGTAYENFNMEWEEGQYSFTLSMDDGVGNSFEEKNEYDMESGSSFGDNIVSSCFNEMSADEGLEGFFQDSEGSYQNLGSDESFVFNNENHFVSLQNDGVEESTEGSDGNDELEDYMVTVIELGTTGEPIEEPWKAKEEKNKVLEADNETLTTDLQFGYDKSESTRNIVDNASLPDRQEKQYLKDMLMNQGIVSCQNFTDTRHDYCSGDIMEDCHSEKTVVESLLPKTEDTETKQSLQKELVADAGDETDEYQKNAAKSQIRIPSVNLLQDLFEAKQDVSKEESNGVQYGAEAKVGELKQAFVGEDLQSNNDDKLQNQSEKDHHGSHGFKISYFIDSENQTHSGLNQVDIAQNRLEDFNDMHVKNSTKLDPEETLSFSKNAATATAKTAFVCGGRHTSEEILKAPNNLKIIRCKRPAEELAEPRELNPRDPNYLPVEPNPETEKVDLRHQMMDERKKAQEWMLDYALQQTVFKLAPACKKKVSLLVEAFEKVIPIPKYESHIRHKSPAFAHARPTQACS